jgi:hypothetical protein
VFLDSINNKKARNLIRFTGFFYILLAIWLPVLYVGKDGGVLTYILPVLSLIATVVYIEMASQYKTRDVD